MAEPMVVNRRLGLVVAADTLSGNFPERSRLVAGSLAGQLTEFELQFFKRLRLNLLIGRALQTATPLALILRENEFQLIHGGHLSEILKV